MRKICIDLFSCSGGFSHGWIEGGGEVVLAVDCWAEALLNHHYNHPSVEVRKMTLGGDIEKTAEVLRGYLPIDEDFHFHLHGSPPCQAISNASNASNVKADDGMFLVLWFLELVEHMKPDSWSMENVVPVAKRLPEGTPYVELNAADFGVPQNRKRIFAGEGWKVKPQPQTYRMNHYHTIANQYGDFVRIVSRRHKRGQEPTFYRTNEPAHTITQVRHMIERLTWTGRKTVGWEVVRGMDIEEMCVLQGWCGMKFNPSLSFQQKKLMVANMVCPPIAEAICEGIL